jgi:hypothetical protein
MNKVLNWFIRGWVALAIGVNVIAVLGFFVGAHSFWAGWQRVADTYGPFNLTNWFAEIVLISPAFGAYLWLEHRKKRATEPQQRMSTEDAQQIINAYGEATERPASFPGKRYEEPTPKNPAAQQMIDELNAALSKGSLRDIRTLPYPKQRIKQALLIAMSLTPPGPAREQLRTGYVLLGDWQDPSVPDPMAAMVAEGKALLAELKAFEEKLPRELNVRSQGGAAR